MALKVVRRKAELPPPGERQVGFVPTMGAFHEGHLELMRTAKRECGTCAISIFVNPTQFGPGEDFERYPRQEERDLEMAESAGVDFAFVPTVEEMYDGSRTKIQVEGVSERWEGEYRPRHFDGVATIVAKLFLAVRPHTAYFGLKDFQQCAVIRQMVRDLNMPVALRFCETVREPDGLAMSSRNAYLSPEERSKAPILFRVLAKVARQIAEGGVAEEAIRNGIEELRRGGFLTEYLAWVDSDTLEPATNLASPTRLIVAARLGRTRLIDNCEVS